MVDKRILVTGASGFLGRALISELAKQDCQLLAFKSNNPSDTIWKKESFPFLKEVALDLRRPESYQDYLNSFSPTHCFHLAWRPSGEVPDVFENLVSLQNLVGLLDRLPPTCRVVFPSTCLVYKSEQKALLESDPLLPNSRYSICKRAAEIFAVSKRFVAARIFNVYGNGAGKGRLCYDLLTTLLADKPFLIKGANKIRDYLEITDVINALVLLAFSDFHGEVNVCSGIPLQVKDLALAIACKIQKEWLLSFAYDTERSTLYGDNSLLKRSTGWEPKIDIQVGLDNYIQTFRSS